MQNQSTTWTNTPTAVIGNWILSDAQTLAEIRELLGTEHSSDDNHEAIVEYVEDFIDAETRDKLFAWVMRQVQWSAVSENVLLTA